MDSFWTPQYYQKVLATNPIAYWMLDEKSGAVAYDMVSGRVAGAQNGAHTGVTLVQPGIGDGRTSPLYDGANDYTNVHSAALAAAFNGSAGTVMIWSRVSGVGVWTDGSTRRMFWFAADVQNRVAISKLAANNQVQWEYEANNIAKTVVIAGFTTTDWQQFAVTWDINAGATGEVKAYLNGVQVGATQTNLGVWAGALAAGSTQIGSFDQVPIQVWDGTLNHCALWTRALEASKVLSLRVVQ